MPPSKKRVADTAELDITPMIDVTFLLLIFFMVTSTMQPDSALEMPPAQTGTGVDLEQSIVVSLALEGNDVVYIAGEPDQPQVDGLDELMAYVEQMIDQGKSKIIIKADRDVAHGEVRKLAQELNTRDGLEFYLGVKEKPPA